MPGRTALKCLAASATYQGHLDTLLPIFPSPTRPALFLEGKGNGAYLLSLSQDLRLCCPQSRHIYLQIDSAWDRLVNPQDNESLSTAVGHLHRPEQSNLVL